MGENDITNGKLIPFAEAARMLGKTPQALRNRVMRGTINAVKSGRDWFMERADVEEELAKKKNAPL